MKQTILLALLCLVCIICNAQQRTFSSYTPQYDADQYGQLLQHHDQEFKEMMRGRSKKINNLFEQTGDAVLEIEDINTRSSQISALNSLIKRYNAEEFDISDDNTYKWLIRKIINYQP